VLAEAYLSFLGVGTPPEIPSWGNIIAEGGSTCRSPSGTSSSRACLLALMVLSINILGDGLRDALDPRRAS
jgi:peptide/nickel transport system permease protein